jgi:hypothetical protein
VGEVLHDLSRLTSAVAAFVPFIAPETNDGRRAANYTVPKSH